MKKTARITRAWRLFRLATHLMLGILEVAIFFPWQSASGRTRAIARWSRRMCHILNIRVRTQGVVPSHGLAGAVLVANHVSWIDIFVLNTAVVSRFVSKAEVRNWPLIGWLCQHTGTLFVTRERRQDTHRVNQEIAAALAGGDCVAIFPEGSTTDGFDVITFNASLLQPAIEAGATLAPVALRYYDAQAKRSDAASYVGEMSLLESIGRILTEPRIDVTLDFLPPISSIGRHRRELARESQSQIGEIVLADSPVAARPLPPPAQRVVAETVSVEINSNLS